MTKDASSVFHFLSASQHSKNISFSDLGAGRSAAVWQNCNDRMTYDNPKGHAFSFYVKNGTGTRRLDGTPSAGWPGAVCILPEGHLSEWEITDTFQFIHFYTPDRELRRVFADTFDRDARLMDVPDLSFEEAPLIGKALVQLINAAHAQSPLTVDVAITEFVHALFTHKSLAGKPKVPLSGGLSSHVRRRVLDFIEAHLDETLSLSTLSNEAGLSEFHLQRSFQASLGVSPQEWVSHRRIERAKTLIREGKALQDVAFSCGFSSQSHFTRSFKAKTSLTPGMFQKAL